MKTPKFQYVAPAALIFFFAILPIATAKANSLVSTSPISGSTVSISPSSVTVTGQAILLPDGNEVTVTDSAGNRVDDGTLTIIDMSATVGLKPLVDAGVYKVNYILIAEGESALEGSFNFNFSAPSTIATTQPHSTVPAKSASSSWGTSVFVIGALVLAFFVLVGLSLYARKIFKDR